MNPPKCKMQFFEHPDNPLPADGAVHAVRTDDGFDLRLGLWPVPGFKIMVWEEEDAGADQGSADGPEGPDKPEPSDGAESPDKSSSDIEVDAGTPAEEANPPAISAQDSSAEGSETGPKRDDAAVEPIQADDPQEKSPSTNQPASDEAESDAETKKTIDGNGEISTSAKTLSDVPDGADKAPDANPGPDEAGSDDAVPDNEDPDKESPDIEGEGAAVESVASTQPKRTEPDPVQTGNNKPAKAEPVVGGAKDAAPTMSAAPVLPQENEAKSASGTESSKAFEDAVTMSGTVILLNGRTEFIEKYGEVITELIDRGFCVAALDWRGQGGSERLIKRNPRKGHIDDMDSYVDDLIALLDYLETTNCPKPYFCLAHSTGGQILARAAPYVSGRITRAVATAPFLDLAGYRLPKSTLYGLAATLTYAGLGEMFAPGTGDHSPSEAPFEGNPLCSDLARFERTRSLLETYPELAIGGPTISWIYAALKSASEISDISYISRITLPMLFMCASDDRIVSTKAVEDFTSMARTISNLSIPGAQHEILMERDEIRAQFWAAFDAFIPGSD